VIRPKGRRIRVCRYVEFLVLTSDMTIMLLTEPIINKTKFPSSAMTAVVMATVKSNIIVYSLCIQSHYAYTPEFGSGISEIAYNC